MISILAIFKDALQKIQLWNNKTLFYELLNYIRQFTKAFYVNHSFNHHTNSKDRYFIKKSPGFE